jgi:hypothetical protein
VEATVEMADSKQVGDDLVVLGHGEKECISQKQGEDGFYSETRCSTFIFREEKWEKQAIAQYSSKKSPTDTGE